MNTKENQQKGNLFDDWAEIPIGICLIRMFHERTGKHCLHLQMKLNDGPWHDQPHVPMAYSQESTKDSHREFWDWAEKTLPIFDYKEIVKSQGVP
jgi:hypothetical protein